MHAHTCACVFKHTQHTHIEECTGLCVCACVCVCVEMGGKHTHLEVLCDQRAHGVHCTRGRPAFGILDGCQADQGLEQLEPERVVLILTLRAVHSSETCCVFRDGWLCIP